MNFIKKNRILMTIIVVVIVLLATWYFNLFNFASKAGLPAIKKVTYQNKDNKYSVTYTNNWQQLTDDELIQKGVEFDTAFINKKDGNVVIGINNPIVKDQSYEKDLEGSLKLLVDGLTEQYKDRSFTITDLSSGNHNNIPYLSIAYVLDGVKQTQRFYITDDSLYIIVASAPKDIFDKYASDINQFFDNYKLK